MISIATWWVVFCKGRPLTVVIVIVIFDDFTPILRILPTIRHTQSLAFLIIVRIITSIVAVRLA